MKLLPIFEEIVSSDVNKCTSFDIHPLITSEAAKFESSELWLRSGGISNDTLDMAAFGFTQDGIKTLLPKQLRIKWKEDLENVKWEIQQSGLSPKVWASKVDLTEPIDVIYEKDKFFIDDGHHRYMAAKILGKTLNVSLEVHQNPILKIGNGLGYDELHRCIFQRVTGRK